jgi:putative addiction module CopG family antidote
MSKRNTVKTVTRNVSVTAELDEFVNSNIESGLYGNYSEVVRAALRTFRHQAEERSIRLRRLASEASESLNQQSEGDVLGFDRSLFT